MVAEHRGDCGSLTAVAQVVAEQHGLGKETVRRWAVQADIDARPGVTSEESAEIKRLKAENRRLREDNETCGRPRCTSLGSSTPAIADHVVYRGHARRWPRRRVDLQGAHRTRLRCRGATYRSWRQSNRSVSARTVTDPVVIDALLAASGKYELYGRRKMTAHLRRQRLEVAHCPVDRSMGDLGVGRSGCEVPIEQVAGAVPVATRDGGAELLAAPHAVRAHGGSLTSPTSAPGPGSSTSRSSSTSPPNASWDGTSPPTSAPAWS